MWYKYKQNLTLIDPNTAKLRSTTALVSEKESWFWLPGVGGATADHKYRHCCLWMNSTADEDKMLGITVCTASECTRSARRWPSWWRCWGSAWPAECPALYRAPVCPPLYRPAWVSARMTCIYCLTPSAWSWPPLQCDISVRKCESQQQQPSLPWG